MQENNFVDDFKKGLVRENAKFRSICIKYTPIIVTIYIILVVISMIMDVIYNKELGFVIKYPGIVILKIMGIFVAIYWTPKIIFILIECILKSKRRK